MDKDKFIKLIKDDPMAFAYVVDACLKLRKMIYEDKELSQKQINKVIDADVWFKACDDVEETLKV